MREQRVDVRSGVRGDTQEKRRRALHARRHVRSARREPVRVSSWTFQLHYDNLVALARQDPRLGPIPGYATVCRFMN